MSDSPRPTHGRPRTATADDRPPRAGGPLVFGSLLVLTGFTVGAYFLHLPTRTAIALALSIATVKGSLVAAWFMHLISERKLIYWVLALDRRPASSRCCSSRRSRSLERASTCASPCRSRAFTSSSSPPRRCWPSASRPGASGRGAEPGAGRLAAGGGLRARRARPRRLRGLVPAQDAEAAVRRGARARSRSLALACGRSGARVPVLLRRRRGAADRRRAARDVAAARRDARDPGRLRRLLPLPAPPGRRAQRPGARRRVVPAAARARSGMEERLAP